MAYAHEPAAVPAFTVHDRCWKARRAAGLEIEELAEKIGVHRHTITHYENGSTKRLKSYVLRAWALACGVDADWLATGYAPRDSNPEPSDYGSGRAAA